MNKFIILFFTLSINSYADETFKQDYIEITSNEMEVREKDGLTTFKGDVKAQQDNLTLKSDIMLVHYRSSNSSSKKTKILRIEFLGNVIIITPNEQARGDKGFYEVGNQQFTILNNVVLNQGNNILTGEVFTYDKVNRKATLKSGNKRAKAIIKLD